MDRGTISAAKVASNSRWYPLPNKVISILFALQDGPVLNLEARNKKHDFRKIVEELELVEKGDDFSLYKLDDLNITSRTFQSTTD